MGGEICKNVFEVERKVENAEEDETGKDDLEKIFVFEMRRDTFHEATED